MATIPNQTFVGLALYDPCAGTVGAVSNDCGSFSPSAAIGVSSIPGGSPSAVMLVGAGGSPIIRDSDQVNIYNGNCGTPRILGNAGMLVQWIAVADATQPPQWTVYIEAGAPSGTPIAPMQPVVLRNNNTGSMAAITSTGQLILASVSRSVTCSPGGYGQPQATNAAYFVFTTASDAITATWTLPTWVPSFFPYWWQSIDNWWPRWWTPSSSSCPPWVVGCRGYNPPPPPSQGICNTRFAPWWCGHGGVGGDHDVHGCVASAGYQWCPEQNRCLRPWEEGCHTLQPGPDHVKPVIPAHANIGGDPATWAPKQKVGGDPATWAPKQKVGGDPATWTPTKPANIGGHPATWTPTTPTAKPATMGAQPATWAPRAPSNPRPSIPARPAVPRPLLPAPVLPAKTQTPSITAITNAKRAAGLLGTKR